MLYLRAVLPYKDRFVEVDLKSPADEMGSAMVAFSETWPNLESLTLVSSKSRYPSHLHLDHWDSLSQLQHLKLEGIPLSRGSWSS